MVQRVEEKVYSIERLKQDIIPVTRVEIKGLVIKQELYTGKIPSRVDNLK